MTQIIIAFRSRTDSIRFSDFISRAGVLSTLINTPRELSTGCGVSVKVEEKYADIVIHLLNQFTSKQSYIGTYKLIRNGAKTLILPIN